MHSRSVFLCMTGHYNFYYVCMYAIDGFAPSTDSAAPSIDPSMAQQSVDGAALSTDPISC